MQDLYLSFTDESAAKAVLYREEPIAWEPTTELGREPVATEWVTLPNYRNIDTIGSIYKPTGAHIEQDGRAVPVMEAVPGWHVNVRLTEGEDASALEPFVVQPKTPIRVWA